MSEPAPVPFSVKPGKVGPWRSVSVMLRQQHDDARESVAKAIAERTKKGIPTDDLIDWRSDLSAVLGACGPAADRDEIVSHLERALALANGGMRPIAPFTSDPATDGLEVKFRALSKADVMEMRADIAAVVKGEDTASLWRAGAETQRAFRPFLAKALAAVRGLRLEDGVAAFDPLTPTSPQMAEALDAIDEAGLLSAVFACARAYQDLPSFQRAPFGLLHPSTLESSAAATAPPIGAGFSGVMAAQQGSTLLATQIERPTDAHNGTSSTMTSAGDVSGLHLSFTTSQALGASS